jgi:hypothetical protein
MADPSTLDPNVLAYIERNDGDLIKADEWNDIQRCPRQDIRQHKHSGADPDDGIPIGPAGLEDGAVTATKIADGSLPAAKLQSSSIGSDLLQDQAIQTNKIADNAVTAAKIKNGSDSIICNFPIAGNIVLQEELIKFTPEVATRPRLRYPTIVADGDGNLHAMWIGYSTALQSNTIWYARMDKDGILTIPAVSKSDLNTEVQNPSAPSILVDADGNLQVVWAAFNKDTNTNALYYAKLDNGGDPIMKPKIIVPTKPLGNLSTYDKAYADNPDIVLEGDGNIAVFWEGLDQKAYMPIWYCKIDKNGIIMIDPTIKFRVGTGHQWSPNQFPKAVLNGNGKLNLYWRPQNEERGMPYHARLSANGVIDQPPAPLHGLQRAKGFFMADALRHADGNIQAVVIGQFPSGLGVVLPRLDNTGQMIDTVINRYLGAIYHFGGALSATYDADDKMHLLFLTSHQSIGYTKIDPGQQVTGATLTELLTTYSQYNF